MGGINPNPPPDDPPGPRTRAEADAANKVGRENRQRVGLSGYGGRSEAELEYISQQRAFAEQQQAQQQQQQRQAVQQNEQQQGVRESTLEPDYASQAREAAGRRSGFTDPTTLGDFGTQQRALELSGQGMDYEAAVGVALEEQRSKALSTPTTKDDQYYGNELSKWKQNKIELGASYHNVGMKAGVPIPENPYELQADLALESLKGSPHKRSEVFSPVSGRMKEYLPGEGRGLQETMWDTARTGRTPQGSYMRAIEVINSSKGGLVTGTMGRPNDQGPGRTSPGGGGGAGAEEFRNPVEINARSPGWGVLTKENRELTAHKERIMPTGELPLLGVVPVVSGIIAAGQTGFENAGIFDKHNLITYTKPTGNLIKTKTVASKMAGGKSDFMYKISTSPGGLDTAEWTPSRGEKVTVTESDPFPVGDPKKVTRTKETTSLDPITGETITTTTTETDVIQEMAVNRMEKRFGWDISEQTLRETKSESSVSTSPGILSKVGSPVTQAVTRFEDSIRAKLPPAEQGERALRIASLANPFTAAPVVASVLTERFNPNAAGGAQTVEMLVGHRGQYAEFRERPLATGTSYVIGLGFGGITRGAGAVGARISKVGPVAEKAVRYTGKGAGLVLGGMYATDIGIRSTKGLTDFDPTRVAQRAIVTSKHELVPLTIGAMHGYSAPEIMASVGKRVPRPDFTGIRASKIMETKAPAKTNNIVETTGDFAQDRINIQVAEIQRNLKGTDPEKYFIFSKQTGELVGEGVGGIKTIPGETVTRVLKSARSKFPYDEFVEAHTHPEILYGTSPPSPADLIASGNWDYGVIEQVVIAPKRVYSWYSYPKALTENVGGSLKGAGEVVNKFSGTARLNEQFMRVGTEYGLDPAISRSTVYDPIIKTTRIPIFDNEAGTASFGGVKRSTTGIVEEPAAIKKQAGYSIAQMQMAHQMKSVPKDYGAPRSYSVKDATEILYSKTPAAGGSSPGPSVRGFEPSSSVNKMIQSRTPSFRTYNLEPTYSVADNKMLASYGAGRISPVNIDKIPGTTISRLKPEHSLPEGRVGKTGRYFMDERPVSSGGGGSGGVVGNVGSRGGVAVDVATGRLVSKSRIKTESFDVSSGIFKSGEEYGLSAEGMTLHHLSPNRRVRLVEDLQPEVIYAGKIPGITRPEPPRSDLILGVRYENRQSQFTEQGNLLSNGVLHRSQQRTVPEKLTVQKRVGAEVFAVKPATRVLTKVSPQTTTLSATVAITKTSPFSSTRTRQVQEPAVISETRSVSQQRATRTPFTETTVTRTPEPPRLPPGFMLPDAGGSAGDRPFSPGGSYGWSHLNIMADMEYLSHGMAPAPFTTRRKKKKSIFG